MNAAPLTLESVETCEDDTCPYRTSCSLCGEPVCEWHDDEAGVTDHVGETHHDACDVNGDQCAECRADRNADAAEEAREWGVRGHL